MDEEGRPAETGEGSIGVGIEVKLGSQRSLLPPPYIQSHIVSKLKEAVEEYLTVAHRFDKMNAVPKVGLLSPPP